ncbi:hypothetical protein Cni_G20170 [Canna indica]|uniref:Uncharacterized protein n=1 Tax=Canna indica TaxID=4628 RepID=A0AAQ3KQU7_9LILI|nr:hypothetical protein Cni_G20170 [Canna indica]
MEHSKKRKISAKAQSSNKKKKKRVISIGKAKITSICLSERHREIISQTSFSIFLTIGDFPTSKNIVDMILKQWVKESTFEFKSVQVEFTSTDVALLLGLPDNGNPIPTSSSQSSKGGILRFFGDTSSINRSMIECNMIRLHKSEKEEDIMDDFLNMVE